MGLLSVSIDLDEVDCYAAIHGIDIPQNKSKNPVYTRALPRFIRFAEELGIRTTLFVVGKDIQDNDDSASLLSELASNGHEIGNHTMHHRYDLTSLSLDVQAQEIDDGTQIIKSRLGRAPVGFRAPGYNVNKGLTDLLSNRGYSYDSSVFPCPAYYSAKAAAIAIKSLKGKVSLSKMGDPRILKAPTSPYRIGGEGVWSKGRGLTELPITVVTKARLPFIGTSLALMGALPSSLMAKRAAKLPFVNLELHGIDFADMDGDALSFLGAHQPDLRIPLPKRRHTLKTVIDNLLQAGLEPVTLNEAATRVFA